MTILEQIKLDMEKASQEMLNQLIWYGYEVDFRRGKYLNLHIDGNLQLRKWWFVLREIK